MDDWTNEPRSEPFRAGSGETPEQDTGMREKAQEIGERIRERAAEAAESGRERAAEGLEDASRRLHERARSLESEHGMKHRAGRAMHRASAMLESGADYLRTHDFDSARNDATRQVRSHPIASLGIAIGTGFLLGRLLR